MKRFAGAVLPIVLLVVAPLDASAQQRQNLFAADATATAPAFAHVSLAQEPPEETPEDMMSKSGMFLGIVGMLAGAAIGSGVSQSHCDDKRCTSRYAFTGALISGSILVPIGVHIANEKRRNLLASLGVSAVAGTALYYGMNAIPGRPIQIAPFLAAPVQMVTSIKIETR